MPHHLIVRDGKKEDMPRVFELVRELAVYEKAEDQIEISLEQLTEDAFGKHPLYGLIVAEVDNIIVGISIYYTRYSTWKGKRLYIEDIIVTETHRRQGIGSKLFEATARHARKAGYNGMNWLVLDWNDPALRFYKKYGAYFEPSWVNSGLTAKDLEKF